jgi:hypothetical protein
MLCNSLVSDFKHCLILFELNLSAVRGVLVLSVKSVRLM